MVAKKSKLNDSKKRKQRKKSKQSDRHMTRGGKIPASSLFVIRIVGSPGYAATGLAWLSLAGAASLWFLTSTIQPSKQQLGTTANSPAADLLNSGSLGDGSVVSLTLTIILAVIVVTGSLAALLYLFWVSLRNTAHYLNKLILLIAPESRQYFYKIGVSIIGYSLLALLMIFIGELPWIASILAVFGISISCISFVYEHVLLARYKVHISTLW